MKKLLTTYFQRQAFQLCCLSVFIVMITTLEIKANDGFVDVIHGGVTLKNGKNATVQMDSEYVEIRLYKKYYTVTATFWLRNSGNARTIQIGFPHKYQDYSMEELDSNLFIGTAEKSLSDSVYVFDFKTFMNDSLVANKSYRENNLKLILRNEQAGKILTFTSLTKAQHWWNTKGKFYSDKQRNAFYVLKEAEWLYWFVRKVNFQKNQTIKTAVEFKAKYMDPFGQYQQQGRYIFGSGSSWKNVIRKSIFKIVNLAPERTGFTVRLPKKYQGQSWVKRTKCKYEEEIQILNYKPATSDEISFDLEDPRYEEEEQERKENEELKQHK